MSRVPTLAVLEPPAVLAGRLLLAAIFLHEGVAKITSYAGAAAYMQAYGIPDLLLPLAILTELGGGLLILLGWQTRAAAFLLCGFCLATALLFHTHFADRNQLLHFEKNLTMAGGFLVLWAHGPGAWSIDRWRERG